ncbi:hypothetical protein G6F56_012426 [Rhizopus delemar]|nr:hypothetical protein G6F56_012426 [Rhizopus delemar]
MNIDPSNRHLAENMNTFTVTPGPSKPKDFMSFLKPIIDEIKALGVNGMSVRKHGVEVYKGKVHLLGMTGDMPGVAELINHTGHSSYRGCRFCDTVGILFNNTVYFPNYGQLRSLESFLEANRDLGLRGLSEIISSIPTLITAAQSLL